MVEYLSIAARTRLRTRVKPKPGKEGRLRHQGSNVRPAWCRV